MKPCTPRAQGDQGIAQLQHRTQAGPVHHGTVQGRHVGPRHGFFSRANELHFNERPFLNHTVYVFITKTNRHRMMQQSNFSTLCRGNIIPKELQENEEVMVFREAVEQFQHIMNVSGYFTLTRLTAEEIAGNGDAPGLLDRYFTLCGEKHASLEDIRLGADEVRVGDNILCLHTLSDTDDLPANVSTDIRYERLSTDRSDCKLSFAAPVGLLLSCNHIYNQYIFIDDSSENLSRFEKQARNMHSLSKYSRANQINKEWLEEYMNTAHSQGLTSVRAHFNVLAWSDDREELKHIKNDVGSALAMMECKPRHNTVDTATLYWAAMPGNEADFPSEESFYTFIDPPVFLHGGDQLQGLPVSFRHQDGGPAERKARTSGHFRPADGKERDHQPQQVYPRSVGQRKELFHQPHDTPVLRAGHPCADD